MTNPYSKFIRSIKARFTRERNTSTVNHDISGQAERELVQTLAKSRLPSLRQLRYLPRILTPGERFLLRALSGFFIVALVFLGARFYNRHVIQVPRSGGEVVEALVGTVQYINPVLVSTNDVDRDLVHLMYSGLMKRNDQLDLLPDLAQSYEVSTDKKVYTFHLRDKMVWSDGQPITVDDVVLTFELIQDPLFKSPLRSQFRTIKVERVDDVSLRFTLPQASASFLSNLTVGILPAHLWGDVPASSFALVEYNLKPVGSGPFTFQSLKRDAATGSVKEIRLARNDSSPGPRPYLDRLTLKIFPDFESAEQALSSNRVEGLSSVQSDQHRRLKHITEVNLQLPQYAAIFFNAKRDVVKPREVRQALAQSLDRSTIVSSVLQAKASVVDGPFASHVPGFAGKLQLEFNPEAARATLDAAGWKLPDGEKTRKKGDDELAITLSIVDQAEDHAIAEMVKQSWEAIGVKVTITSFDSMRIPKEVIKPRDYDALLYGQILSPDGDLYPFWYSTQEQDPGLNLTRFYNKDADKLLEELRETNDPAQVSEKRIKFQQLLSEGLPAIFLYSPVYSYGLAKRVKGFTMTHVNVPSDRFNDVEHWYVKTKISFKK